jgi:hypothetical protein
MQPLPAGWIYDEDGKNPIEITRTYVRWFLEQPREVQERETIGHHKLVINDAAFQRETSE